MKGVIFFLFVIVSFVSCSQYKLVSMSATQISVDKRADTIQDQRMVALLKPYADSSAKVANTVIGYSDQTMRVKRPEGVLSDFFADAMLSYSQQRYPTDSVSIAVTNVGGLRNPIFKGPVTVGKIYELMPFENALMVLYLKGTAVQQMADSIAKYGGAVAGIRFGINGSHATHVMVQGVPLEANKIYAIATNDYIAKGNDHFDALLQAVQAKTYPVSLRRLMIEYIQQETKQGRTIHQLLDGRIYEDK
jgi:2',3'-cyclic-nucleotide 2'-phosphodiesterase (5'-nucleotidase family)